ncbi:glutathione S-transferase family protein [Undibacterium sp. Tian12W]|uniref:glutathione S-transferase family protein n=1 Tax=Undibacterium sp. Tian12W TaxID=3413054 RepID=UPI003BF28973
MSNTYTLVSHKLCPYVQRAAITLAEKGLEFERIDIDLANKPDWFLQVSPLGKTPVLLVDGQAIFESAVICEYLDETTPHRLHPEAALERAQHRAWIEFASATLNNIGGFYNAADAQILDAKVAELKTKFAQLEKQLGDGPYFSGENFSLVDAAFAPVFRYFDVFEQIADFGFFTGLSKLQAWRRTLQARTSVRTAVSEDYPALLSAFLHARHSALSALMP